VERELLLIRRRVFESILIRKCAEENGSGMECNHRIFARWLAWLHSIPDSCKAARTCVFIGGGAAWSGGV
jgi:hypothetical protein